MEARKQGAREARKTRRLVDGDTQLTSSEMRDLPFAMRMRRPAIATGLFAAALFLTASSARAQSAPYPTGQPSQDGMGGMKMPATAGKSDTPGKDGMQQETSANPDAAKSAMDAMSGAMNMNAHMFMTALRPKNPQDDQRAAEIVETVLQAIEKYKDYHVALADGFEIFLPNVPQEHYHFTNRHYAMEAVFAFNPAHPTSLLYKKVNGAYVLEGAMFTAARWATEDQLDKRVPLSVARWHKHVNFCLPPKGAALETIDWKEFGPGGSIATKQACDEANGRWIPQVFGWMVHVYPYERDPARIWAH